MKTNRAKATTTSHTFRMACSISTTIHASPERVWAFLTDARGFPSWNSTVTSIEGEIAEGKTLKLKVLSAPERVFKPKVARVEVGRSMVWSDGFFPMFKGVRTFCITPKAGGSTEFSMKEEFLGLMLPLIRRSLPDFAPVFETYAEDLKRAAEGSAS